MLYLFGRLALSDSHYFQQEEEEFDYQQKTNDRRSEGPQPDPRAAAVSRRPHRGRYFPLRTNSGSAT